MLGSRGTEARGRFNDAGACLELQHYRGLVVRFRQLLVRCVLVLAIGALYAFVSADLYVGEGLLMVLGVLLTATITLALILAGVAMVRLVLGMAIRPQMAVRPSRHVVAVALVAATVAAFPLSTDWPHSPGVNSGVLPLAETVRVKVGGGDAVWVYFDSRTRIQELTA